MRIGKGNQPCPLPLLTTHNPFSLSARRLLRRAFRKSDWKAGDVKHLVASLLPTPLYRNLVDLVTRRSSARIEG